MRKKKANQLIALTGISGFSLAAACIASVAWFISTIKITDINGTGYTDAAYFAYGSGEANDPFGISEIRHLSNLAWLQYNGSFDNRPYYFELANDINEDGTEYVMPPIGTESHPFIGVFDGNGYTIYNIKITNDYSQFTKKPHNITYSDEDAEVIGFFGVVGNLDGESYSSQTNSLHDVTLENLTVESKTDNTLIGLAAGYINADMSGVKVGTSTIKTNGNAAKTAYTDKLSDYGLVGYTTKTGSSGTFEQRLSQYYNSKSDGDDPGWGGSIAIKDLYGRLNTMRSSYAYSDSNGTTGLAYTDTYNPEGERVNHAKTKNIGQALYNYNETSTKNGVTYNSKIGALQANYGSNSNGGIYYLSGGHFTTKNYSSYYTHSGRPIVSGNNYLHIDSNLNITNAVSPSNPILWTIPNDGSSGTISTQYNGTTYYLNNNSGTLSVSTNTGTGTTWNVNAIDGNVYLMNSGKVVNYSNGWSFADCAYIISYSTGGTTYYFKSSGGNTSVTTTTNISEAAKWKYDSSTYYLNSGDYLGIECTRSGSFLSYTLSVSKPAQAGLTGSYNGRYSFSSGEGLFGGTTGTFSASVSGSGFGGWDSTTFYLKYSNGTLSADTSSGSTFTITKSYPSSVTTTIGGYVSNSEGPDYHTTSTTSGMDYSEQDVTYLPITINGTNDLQAKDTNTGYIIGGSSYTSASSSYGYGNVRVASFYTIADNLKNYDETAGAFNTDSVWTRDSTGVHHIDDDNNSFVKYLESKGKVEQSLSSGSTIYGLHFMSAAINKNEVVNAKYAMINGDIHSDYKMPANSIDFNLKEQGYINFFAAPYGNDSNSNARTVDSFFSLHMIKRNGTEIDDIYEIEEVYSDGVPYHSYIYRFSNGMYSIPYSIDKYNPRKLYILNTKTPLDDVEHGGYADGIYTQINQTTFSTNYSSFSSVFNMSWLKDYSYYTGDDGFHEGFYFEIPTNPGEYALGTVANKSFGAYLMYLDIAANAANKDQITAYAITTFQSGLKFPSGVDFNATDVSGDNGGETFAIIIVAGATSDGDIDFTVSGTTIGYDGDFATQYAYSEKPASGASPPAAAVLPPSTGTRVIYTHILTTDYLEWDIQVTEILDENGDATSTTITSVRCGGEPVTVEDIPESFVLNSIRPQVNSYVATFTRTSGENEFVIVPTYGGDDYKTVSLVIEMNGTTLEVSNIATGYTFTINGTPVSNNSVYPSN